MALINEAAGKGDYKTAAQLEQQRNEKIKGEGLGYKTTSDYQGWLDKTDYGEKIISAVSNNKSKQTVADLLSSRVEKAGNTIGMEQWTNDDIYDMAIAYLQKGTNSIGDYESSYSGQIYSLLDKLLEREAFSYDYQNDPLYHQYAEVYRREGKRATQDALGMSAQNTGGYASSYATGAAQQAGAYYGAKLGDKIPELYNIAYEIYLDDYKADVQNMGILTDLEREEYSRYRDSVEDMQRAEEFDYKKYIADLEYQQAQDKQAYNESRDAIKDSRYETEWQYELSRDAINDARYEAQQAAKAATAAAKTAKGSASAGKTVSSSGDDDVKVYGLNGTFSLAEAEAMVAIGLAERVTENGKGFYKLIAIG